MPTYNNWVHRDYERPECFAYKERHCMVLTGTTPLKCTECKFFKTKKQLDEELLTYNGTTNYSKITEDYKNSHPK